MASWRPAPDQVGAFGWRPGCRWRQPGDDHPGDGRRPGPDPGGIRLLVTSAPTAPGTCGQHRSNEWWRRRRRRTSAEDVGGCLWVYGGLSPVGGCGGRLVAVASGHGQGRLVVAAAAR